MAHDAVVYYWLYNGSSKICVNSHLTSCQHMIGFHLFNIAIAITLQLALKLHVCVSGLAQNTDQTYDGMSVTNKHF